MTKITKIHLVDGVCGAGKTQSAIGYVDQYHSDVKFVIVQPTKELCNETAAQLKAMNIRAVTVSSDDPNMAGRTYDAYRQAIHKLANCSRGGVVITTHHTFFANQHLIDEGTRNNIHLFFDEIPQVDGTIYLNVKGHSDFIDQHFDVTKTGDLQLLNFEIKPGSYHVIEKMLENGLRNQDIFVGPKACDFLSAMLDTGRQKFLNKARWNTRNENEYQLLMHTLLMPDAFRHWNTCRVMGAHAKSSMMFMLWQHHGVEFDDDKLFKLKTDHSELSNRRIEIYYFCGRSWSKYVRDQVPNRFANLGKAVDDLFDNERSLWVANNDVNDTEWQVRRATRISNISHGINKYGRGDEVTHNIAFLSALNDVPAHYTYVANKYGLDGHTLKQAKSFETLYQAVMRTSLRDPISTAAIKIVVADKDQADYLCDLFPDAKQFALDQVENSWGEARKARGCPKKETKKSNTDSKKDSERKKAAYLAELQQVRKNTIDRGIFLTHEAAIHSTKDQLVTAASIHWNDVRDVFAAAFSLKYRSKSDNSLLNFVSFKSDSRTKGKADIEYVAGIQLDFDCGMLPWQRASAIFSDIRHITYNSYNNGKDNTLRFRIVIPFDTAVTVDIAESIWDVLADRIRSDGWFVGRESNLRDKTKDSGLDVSKRPANSFYYAPCQSAFGKKWSFFDDRYWNAPLLDVENAIGAITPGSPEYAIVAAHSNASPELEFFREALKHSERDAPEAAARQLKVQLQRAEERWQQSQLSAGNGNREWFVLGCAYFRAGLHAIEAESRMLTQLQYARNKDERCSELKGVLKSASSRSNLIKRLP